MHILCVTRSLPMHRLGGMEAVAWDLCRSLAKRDVRVTVLTTATEGLPQRSTIEGVEIVALDAPTGRYSPQWWKGSVAAFAEFADVDIVLSVSIAAVAIAQDRGVRARSRAKMVFQCHGTVDTDFRSKVRTGKLIEFAKAIYLLPAFLRDFRYRAFDAIVSIGPSVTASLERPPVKWMAGAVPVTPIANGIDGDHFRFDAEARTSVRRQFGLGAEVPVVVSASRLHVQKGVAEGLAGFARARAAIPDLQYLIIGDGPDRARLEHLTRDLGIADAVRFAGAIPRERLPDMLSAGDVFLFTSIRQEGLALGPLEAAASGLPSIVSDHLGTPGLETRLVDPRSPQSVEEGMVETFRALHADRASRLPARYSLTSSTDQYVALFERLAGGAA